MEGMTHGSLFAGIGGFDLGFDRAGIETVWTVENDKNCNQVLATHWPDLKRYQDVREVRGLEPVDVISGGFPCQDVSVAGRREGLAGERSGLWFEFARIVQEMEPEWVVVENVPGLLSSAGGADFALIVGTLEQFGYCVSWRVLDSQFFGVPQRRRRVFIVGSLGGTGSIEVLFESEERGISVEAKRLVASGTNGPIATTGYQCDVICRHDGLWVTLSADGGNLGGDSNALLWEDSGVRRLTVVECERLQGFPDGWTEGLSDSARYRCLGNAVTVNVAEWIGKRLV